MCSPVPLPPRGTRASPYVFPSRPNLDTRARERQVGCRVCVTALPEHPRHAVLVERELAVEERFQRSAGEADEGAEG